MAVVKPCIPVHDVYPKGSHASTITARTGRHGMNEKGVESPAKVGDNSKQQEESTRHIRRDHFVFVPSSKQKVLERRDADIASAWNSFTSAAVKHGIALNRRRNARRPHPVLPAWPETTSAFQKNKEGESKRVQALLKRYREIAGNKYFSCKEAYKLIIRSKSDTNNFCFVCPDYLPTTEIWRISGSPKCKAPNPIT